MNPNPQLFLFLDASGTICAEASGPNGSRRKLGAFARNSLPVELVAELFAQRDAAAAQAAAKLRDQQRANIQYVASAHSSAVAARVWSDPSLLFNHALARKLKQAQAQAQAQAPAKSPRREVAADLAALS